MKKQRQKWVCFLAVLTLVLAVLCACGTQPEQEEEPAPVQETEPKGTEASAREHGGYGGLRLDPAQGLHPAGPGGRGTLLPL